MIKITVSGTRGFPGVQGGVESHCEHLYPYLVQRGCDITVFTRKPYIDLEIGSYKGVKFIPLSCPANKFLEAIVHTFKSVLRAKKLHPDILHIHGIGPSFFVPLARTLGMKVVVTHHGPDYKRKKWPLHAKIFLRFCESMGMTFAHEIIAIAQNIADEVKRLGVRADADTPDDARKALELFMGRVIVSTSKSTCFSVAISAGTMESISSLTTRSGFCLL